MCVVWCARRVCVCGGRGCVCVCGWVGVHVCVCGGVHAVCVWGEKPGQWFMEIESWISLKNEGIMTSLPPNHRNLSRLLPTPPNLSELNKTSTSDISDTDLPSFQDIAQAMGLMMMEVVSFVLRPCTAAIQLLQQKIRCLAVVCYVVFSSKENT